MFGFECEISIWKIDSLGTEKLIKDVIEDKFYYIKYDGSIDGGSTGAEINSHPFNWNFLLKNKQLIRKLTSLDGYFGDGTENFGYSFAKQFRVNRSCGFHIHICRKYFTPIHLKNMVTFIYNNNKFIEDISQRKGTYSLNRYAKISIPDHKTAEEFIADSQLYADASSRYRALNIGGHDTIEIRFFQGTLQYESIMAYLEFALASVLFTEQYKTCNADKLTKDNFIKFLNKNTNLYKNLIDLINKRTNWK